MKNIKYISKGIVYSLLLLSSVFFVSCNDKLDTEPSTSLGAKEIFTSPQRIEGLVNGTYRLLKSHNLYGGKFLRVLWLSMAFGLKLMRPSTMLIS